MRMNLSPSTPPPPPPPAWAVSLGRATSAAKNVGREGSKRGGGGGSDKAISADEGGKSLSAVEKKKNDYLGNKHLASLSLERVRLRSFFC